VIEHTVGDAVTSLTAGDLIHIPEGERHRATNTGSEDAVAVIAYDTGRREVEFLDAESE
jgi:quercetin dioxygenase-like cupin family protein